MAPVEGSLSKFSTTNISLDHLADATNGPCLISPARETFATDQDDWKDDTVTHRLTSRIADILYPDNQKMPYRFTHLHEHKQVSALLAEYEPGAHIDPQQLKVLLKHLKPRVPRVDNGGIVGTLYRFIKTFFSLRREWLKAAGEFFALLAYVERCRERGFEGAGPSCPDQTVDFEGALFGIRGRLEANYTTLAEFKQSDRFNVNMRHLFMYFQEIKWQELIRQKRNEQAAKKAEEDEKKRLEIRQRNGRVASRQLGPVTNIEMGDVQQQRILDLMTDTMEFELGIEAEK